MLIPKLAPQDRLCEQPRVLQKVLRCSLEAAVTSLLLAAFRPAAATAAAAAGGAAAPAGATAAHVLKSRTCRGSSNSLQLCKCQQPGALEAQHIQDAGQRKTALHDALQNGLRVVIDCSYALSAQAWHEQQQQAQQQSQQIWGHPVGSPSPAIDAQPQLMAHNEQHSVHKLQSYSPDVGEGKAQAAAGSRQLDADIVARKLVTGRFIHKEIRSVAKQIELSATINKRSAHPVALTVTSYSGALAAFADHMGGAVWPINKYTQPVLELYDPDDIIVMSPDAQEPLGTIDHSKIYVIGGIVDKTVQKGLTQQFAQHHNLASYRLPIKEYAKPLGLDFPGANLRPILTAADVVTALVTFHATQDWVTALNAAVPMRKRRQPT